MTTRTLSSAIVAAFVAAFAPHAASGDTAIAEPGWSTAVTVDLGGVGTDVSGSVSAVDSMGGELVEPASGKELLVSPYLEIGVEGRSPRLLRGPLWPQLVAAIFVAPTFGSRLKVAGTGNPGELMPPDNPIFEEDAIEGQGSQTTVELVSPIYGAELGLSLPFRLGERNYRVGLTAQWSRFEFDMGGKVVRAIKPSRTNPFYRAVSLAGSETLGLNGVGPALEFEGIMGNLGPLGLSCYAGMSASRLLGDRTATFQDSVTISDELGVETYHATWSATPSSWLVRGQFGIRLSWPAF